MEYANAVNYGAQSNAINQQYTGQAVGLGNLKGQEAPRTLASAAGRLDNLNDRLSKVTESLSQVASQIGSLTPVGVGGDPKTRPIDPGAVIRLNDAADDAHNKIAYIENLIAGIQRALG